MGFVGVIMFVCVAFYPVYLVIKFIVGCFTGENFMDYNERKIYEHNKTVLKQRKVNYFWYNYVWQYTIVLLSALVLLVGIVFKSYDVGFFGFMLLMCSLFVCGVGSSYRKKYPADREDEVIITDDKIQ